MTFSDAKKLQIGDSIVLKHTDAPCRITEIEIENKESALAELEEIISMAEELKYRLSTFKVPEVSLKEEPLAEAAERLKELRGKAINH